MLDWLPLYATTIDELARTVVYLLEKPKSPIGMGIIHDVHVAQGTVFFSRL